MKSILLSLLIALALVGAMARVGNAQGCVKPDYSHVPVNEWFGKICCPSGLLYERGQEESPCLGNDVFACWARVTSLPPLYPECLAPSELLDCIPDYVHFTEWTGECVDEECWYQFLQDVEIPAMRVIYCGSENAEGSGTQFYNDLYDTWYWDPNDPGAVPPIGTNN